MRNQEGVLKQPFGVTIMIDTLDGSYSQKLMDQITPNLHKLCMPKTASAPFWIIFPPTWPPVTSYEKGYIYFCPFAFHYSIVDVKPSLRLASFKKYVSLSLQLQHIDQTMFIQLINTINPGDYWY